MDAPVGHRTTPTAAPREQELRALARLQGALLRRYGIGHPQWYAETLVAAAFGGLIERTNAPLRSDVLELWGKSPGRRGG